VETRWASIAPGEAHSPQRPVLGLLRDLLRDDNAKIIIVTADFGRGKSLTARTLAWTLADDFLDEPHQRSSELWYPIFVRCQDAIKRSVLDDTEGILRTAMKRQIEAVLPTADVHHSALSLPQQQATLIALDGLDEVQLDTDETKRLIAALRDSAHAGRRFIIFSRPASIAALHKRVERNTGIVFVRLIDFTCAGATFVNARGLVHPAAALQGANLLRANLPRASLERANLDHANLQGANLRDANLAGAILVGAVVDSANLRGANLQDAHLQSAVLDSAILERANLQKANLHRASLYRANLEDADLAFAILQAAFLQGANLRGAILRRANLYCANLEDAKFDGAQLTDANLEGANLSGADLRRANLEHANLAGVIYDVATKFPPGFDALARGAIAHNRRTVIA
jgi:uncharacterized protein YjbI with pentapeptide repeats